MDNELDRMDEVSGRLRKSITDLAKMCYALMGMVGYEPLDLELDQKINDGKVEDCKWN